MPRKLQKLYLNAGQMKAGTTYLYRLLREHQEIFFSPEKEIHYLSQVHGPFRILNDATRLRKGKSFMEGINRQNPSIACYRESAQWVADYLRPPSTEGWYEDMFKGHSPGQWVADFSNLTCTIPVEGLRKVTDIADEVRVTYCIRDAVSRAFSHAKFHLHFAGQEHDLTALSEEKLRQLLVSRNIFPQSCSEDHIAALHEVFGNDGFRIIRCESLWNDPGPVVNAVCEFLDISPLSGSIAKEAVNIGPKSDSSSQIMQVFEEIFGDMQGRHEALLERHRNIVIG